MEDKFLTIENGVYEYGKEMVLESYWKYQREIWSISGEVTKKKSECLRVVPEVPWQVDSPWPFCSLLPEMVGFFPRTPDIPLGKKR